MNYYNEIDPYCIEWLSNLIRAGLIPGGHVDDRSIEDVEPKDLKGYDQCHFFAGIAGWAYALELAGVPPDAPIWTGSCPCQPLSSAGQRKGHADRRHLWPAFQHLIAECKPPTIFGEQVASKDGREWLSAVRTDLERMGYACGCADLPAAGVGAPHLRQRAFWVAHDQRERSLSAITTSRTRERLHGESVATNEGGGMADTLRDRTRTKTGECFQKEEGHYRPAQKGREAGTGASFELRLGGSVDGMGDSNGQRRQERVGIGESSTGPNGSSPGKAPVLGSTDGRLADPESEQARHDGQPWKRATTIDCADGKARPVEPGIHPLAHGVPGRVGRLRAYGNAIVPQVAAAFIEASFEAIKDPREE